MKKIGFDFPKELRKTAFYAVEDWYQKMLSKELSQEYKPIKRSNFGYYDMAINYATSVMEEAKAINKVAVYNIDHMAQIMITGSNAVDLLNRTLPINVEETKVGQCKYTLLLSSKGTVLDDLIMMRLAEEKFILVINAGHDITDKAEIDGNSVELISDADYILSFKKDDEDVYVEDISEKLAKIDIQGPYSYRVITELYGKEALLNRNNPKKNMSFFTFNEHDYQGNNLILSRTGYTNRWGWELYIPIEIAEQEFKRIVVKAKEFGGLLVGLGGRDENRISAGNFGLPLYGHEYDKFHTPVNAPLFESAVDLDKPDFPGKEDLKKEIETGSDKKMVVFISEGIVLNRGIYIDGKRIGTVTSSINSPNIPLEKRLFLNSERKSVNDENGSAAIGIGWLYNNPFEKDAEGNDITSLNDEAVRIRVEFFREDEKRQRVGKPVKGYISGDGINPATSYKPLKTIEKL